ncbi:MAG: arsenite methyltransferase [Telmatospirillum sp.]|nr:arsenite methyltransferase [Telmatospirillum sp.]
MDQQEQKERVRAVYGDIAVKGGREDKQGCCCSSSQPDARSRRIGYSDEEVGAAPDGANLGLGCGNPQGLAAIREGDVVLDLGSGAGFDCFLAGKATGPSGKVIGVDMTHEMLARARANADKVNATNVEFRLGEIEHLPVADASVDVVISNCVINLSPDKAQVFKEAFRVLKPGGRLVISDIVNLEPLPERLARDEQLLCHCVAGAVSPAENQDWLSRAGFKDVMIEVKPESRDVIKDWAPGSGVERYVVSAMITATRPACCCR